MRLTIERERRRQLWFALVALALIAAAFYGAFIRVLPFGDQFLLRGDFSSANDLEPGNPVRVGGLQIGKVTGVSAGPDQTSIVTMAIDRPWGIHADASLSIEPRLLFEGNFYVGVDEGTPASPPIRSGAEIPLSRTSTPVQIDQLLDVLDAPSRNSLKSTLRAFGSGLGSGSQTATGGVSAPTVPGYAGLREATRQLAGALPDVSRVAQALQGTEPGDLGRAVDGSSDFATALARDPAALSDLVTSTDRVFAALASSDGALASDIQDLDRFTIVAPPTLSVLQRALPRLTNFAHRLDPVLLAAPSTLEATSRLLTQVTGLVSGPELPRFVAALHPLTTALPTVESQLSTLLPMATAVGSCLSRNILPALDARLSDGSNTSGYTAWQDLLHLGAALSGASESFDGDGVALRIGVAEGSATLGAALPGIGPVATSYQGIGVRPAWLGFGVTPPDRPDESCDEQPLADLDATSAAAAPDLRYLLRSASRRGSR